MGSPGDSFDYKSTANALVARLTEHVERSAAGGGRVLSLPPIEQLRDELDLDGLIGRGGLDEQGLLAFLDRYLEHTTALHHPGSLAHQVAVPDVPAALADMMHGQLNNPAGLYEMGAAGVAIELAVIDWMLAKVGFEADHGAGVLTNGGSLANLTALASARAHAAPDAWTQGTPDDLVVLAPASAHYSVARAVALLGLGQDAIVELDCDPLGRVAPGRIDATIDRVLASGKRPMALVAAACATSTGLFDDLAAIGAICQRRDIWLHVDGAHGASALLSPSDRQLLDGIELADSVIWDAHKLLRVSGLCAAVLVRDGDRLSNTFRQEASYVFYDDEGPGVDTLDRSFECTKGALGVKLFLNLAVRGEAGLGAYVADCFERTSRFARLIGSRASFELPYAPESNILCFRIRGDDELQLAVRDQLLAEGDFHISSATILGARHLRITVTSPATDEATIERLLNRIEALALARAHASRTLVA